MSKMPASDAGQVRPQAFHGKKLQQKPYRTNALFQSEFAPKSVSAIALTAMRAFQV
jgi:hypothetical protein